ncbi:ribonuclease Z, mitochondrial isoform X2 [Ceratina calcarata]|uniref:Zinc phosphodiesterase ELAC protein 2 n=1 Tax=Ceratina calcarata TaxID=156304 RepID=A0AAJ7JFV9_9HYME|nr:ribonuclease Z, mitochondrial isoform X2 [Ceratina calcarata]
MTKNIYVAHTHVKSKPRVGSTNVHNLIAMHQKKKLKKFQSHFSAKLKVIGSGAPGIPACLYLISDHSNYLFNCGEGTQRLSQEHHCKLSKIDNIFVTHLTWKNIGGIPGLLLTAQDNGLTAVNIHCSEGIDSFVEITKSFVNFPSLKISYPFNNGSKVYDDHVMSVSYVPIMKSEKYAEESCSDLYTKNMYHTNVNGKRVIDERTQEEDGRTEKRMKGISRTMCFICEVHPKRGRLLQQKCIDFGIAPGPLYEMLKKGLNVVKEDGTIVRSKDVCDPDRPKVTFIVAECPTEEYLDSFVNQPAFSKYQQSTNEEDKVHCIFHFTPENVFNSERYQDWLNKFSGTEHIILNDGNSCMGSEAVHKNQYMLNMLHPEIFPLLSKDCFTEDKKVDNDCIHHGRAMQTIEIRPEPKQLIKPQFHNPAQTYIDEILQIPALANVLEELKANIAKKSSELNLDNIPDYPRIVMLGTGCSVPNKVRNTSGILLRITEDSSMLLDCGEGTLGQLIRFYGISKSNDVMRSIKAIYVSHIHADHHLGLIGLLLRRKRVTNDTLHLLIPKSMISWLNFYNDQFESINQQYTIVSNSDLYLNHHQLPVTIESVLYNALNVKEINTIYVMHCKYSFGIAITLNDGKKIVYSGDTMFSQNLVQLGQDCDLLIHEATMEDGLEKLAKRKCHATTSEAINAGKFMNAKFTLLTHFSQRYSKIPAIPEKETNVGLAYDNMELKLPQLPLLPLFYPCIKIMFNEYNKVIDG